MLSLHSITTSDIYIGPIWNDIGIKPLYSTPLRREFTDWVRTSNHLYMDSERSIDCELISDTNI